MASIASVIWRNNLNETLAVDQMTLQLPPLKELQESAAEDSFECDRRCPTSYSIKVLALDGRHTRAEVSIDAQTLSSVSISVR